MPCDFCFCRKVGICNNSHFHMSFHVASVLGSSLLIRWTYSKPGDLFKVKAQGLLGTLLIHLAWNSLAFSILLYTWLLLNVLISQRVSPQAFSIFSVLIYFCASFLPSYIYRVIVFLQFLHIMIPTTAFCGFHQLCHCSCLTSKSGETEFSPLAELRQTGSY